ncbi:hypothetical protein [Hydrogenophaga sp. 5NK40-0174]|uniref:hypothetical protein n=1 Tax=Hydrogenophaga sp. 5NK40-0174 TaxID=3127649 RepID=UPI0031051482
MNSLPSAPALKQSLRHAMVLGAALIMAACATRAPEPVPEPPVEVAPAEPLPDLISDASTPRDYRRDGAKHLYAKNDHRIFKGKMPPLLYAVGVLQVDVDKRGKVQRLNWMRAPNHVPEVMAEIERTVRAAEPFPAPVRMGSVTYTDVWLWDRSGNFQLDTLTEGQRNR